MYEEFQPHDDVFAERACASFDGQGIMARNGAVPRRPLMRIAGRADVVG